MSQKIESLLIQTDTTNKNSPTLVDDCLYLILGLLTTNKDLYSCILVDKSWAAIAVPILWEAPFRNDRSFVPSPKVIDVYMAFLPENQQGIKLSPSRIPFDYPSYLKELPFDRFCNAIGRKDCFRPIDQDLVIKLLKMFASHGATLRRFDICSSLANQDILKKDWIALPSNPELSSMFGNGLTHFTCGIQWSTKKVNLFNALALNCHNIKNLKVKVQNIDEGIALAKLILAQKQLTKFSLLNSNLAASIVVQALARHTKSLNCLSFKLMITGKGFYNTPPFFNYSSCQLGTNAINAIVQCVNVTKLSFKQCDGLNIPKYDPISTAFPNLTTLIYRFGGHKDHDNATPLNLLSGLVRTSCNTLEMIDFFWSISIDSEIPDMSQLIQAITQCTINLKCLNIPLYTVEQLSLIYQFCDKLENLKINLFKTVNPNNALRIFANKSHDNLKAINILLYMHEHDDKLDELQLDQIFNNIFLKNKQIKMFILDEIYVPKISDEKSALLQKMYPKLKILKFCR
ncbi:20643_t:CDS:1 [Cetraspora pellucida]|uniref:20643_t:CDS:1 n=1 Tax=Cetraspora pellucida TaxID=1433469 RepID=A0A9N8ZM29_9GLOM|nr:20643_t:CDS:1 [Cetraspora pellucida]